MRTAWYLAAALVAGGCAAQPPGRQRPMPSPGAAEAPASPAAYTGGTTAAALLFEPPLVQLSPPIDLDRTGRGEAAFLGFEQTSTSYYNIWTDNREGTDGCDYFDRDSLINRVGSLSR